MPLRTVVMKGYDTLMEAMNRSEPIKPDRSKPFSHWVTGVVLRAFAAHPKHRKTDEAKIAGELLKSRFFQPDKYPDRKNPSFWTKFSFPFWFTDLLSALDSLSHLGFKKDDAQLEKALKWLRDGQRENGLWNLSLLKNKSIEGLPLWISLATCRIFGRLHQCY